MSRYAPPPSAPRRGRPWSRLRQARAASPDRSSVDSPASPRSVSTHSTVKDTRNQNRERYCTVNVNDGYFKDEVLLNFDRLGPDFKPDTLMGITALKGDSARTAYGSMNKQSWDYQGPGRRNFSPLDQDHASNRYVFVAKDMPKEMKLRQPDVDVSVAKHIADAFGMKKGSQVILALVRTSSHLHSVPEPLLTEY